tara:strand:- start:26 stop:229 length:204 start_codon:yes stop_codon:yes gene_type:complete
MLEKLRPYIDKFLEKIISRKLLVWVVATLLLAFSTLTSADWVAISMIYIASQGIVDITEMWRKYVQK